MREDNQPAVLLLDGNSLASLAFTRSLGRAGIHVTVADPALDAPVRHSRYCARYLQYPSPLDHPEAFREWLFHEAANGGHGLLIGTTDYTLPLLDEWREALSAHLRVALPARDAFRRAYDKAATLELAREAGLAIPPTHLPRSMEELERLAAGSRWPLVIKPRSSVLASQQRRSAAGVEYAWNAEELRQRYAAVHEKSPWPMVQEYVSGAGAGCFFLIRDACVLAQFQHLRIRDKNPTGSGSCLRLSVPPDEALMASSERLLRGMGWDGLAMVEFKVDADGMAYLMEVNPRPWGSMQLAVEAGVDFPLLWYRVWTGAPVEPVLNYQSGILCRYLVGDLKHLESVLNGPPPGWRLPYPKRLPTLLNFLRFWGRNLRYDDFAAGDWRPGLAELGAHFRELAGHLFRKLRRAGGA
ncbi:MAG: ATP-grasp domain-containing protein [Acidobacteria bacterium]|nr:ATP-grasp domain-containing protein [Acidobacteriota bacterium]MBI3661917.1 ATP-grasp domain-containing protein [Acidobacteriota bacterium]